MEPVGVGMIRPSDEPLGAEGLETIPSFKGMRLIVIKLKACTYKANNATELCSP